MERLFKIFIINPNLNNKLFKLEELGHIFKQLTVIEEINLKELSVSANINYPFLLDLVNQRVQNTTIKSLEKIAKELGYELEYNLINIKRKIKNQ